MVTHPLLMYYIPSEAHLILEIRSPFFLQARSPSFMFLILLADVLR